MLRPGRILPHDLRTGRTGAGFTKSGRARGIRGTALTHENMTKERAGSFFFLLIGVYVLVQSARLPMGSWTQPGPGVFPFILSLLLSFVGIALLVSSGAGRKLEWRDVASGQVTAWTIIVLTGLFIVGFDRLGFVPASALYLFVLLYAVSRLPVAGAAGLSVGITAAGWVLFVKILNLQLPIGLWRF